MHARFFASQSVHIAVAQQTIPIQHYLRQPQRLVNALVEPSRMEQLSENSFRLKMRPLSFLHLSIQPVVDLKIETYPDGTVHLESVRCEIRGIEYINQRFGLALQGKLTPKNTSDGTILEGIADLEVQVELPPPFWLTPKPLLEATGNGLLKSVLLTIKQRLMHQLLSDYYQWVNIEQQKISTNRQPVLSINN
ncbi:DUF1997 domain-containing protein [Merismopedia glauca]|uniref:DUF1997 domain-containing protein n=1 Tax=Merismopedia glauca CCAP 1448/3 TaxID=1296344 RepID=A0A2T1C9Q9_9CYAN|nr:DUF1997 domain-containing protein [Merismopedia glauca]PSB05000.1 hypothetical protein C7B64_01150 [Merismopedia glauca CCAP 1448/3]